MIKPIINKLKRLLTISLSLAIILTVLPMNTVHVHAASYVEFVPKDFGSPLGNASLLNKSLTKNGVTLKFEGSGRDPIKYNSSEFIFGSSSSSQLKLVVSGTDICRGTAYRGYEWSVPLNTLFYAQAGQIFPQKIRIYKHDFSSKTTNATYLKTAATCTSAAVYYYKCASCSAKGTGTYTYGSALGHNYTVLQKDANQHWYKCSRCAATNTKVAHSGGTATCTAKAKCSTCGQSYGNTIAHSYTVLQSDASGHWYKCSRCTATNAKVAHSGGTATCTTPAVCSTCGQSYGTVGGHNWSTAWSFDDSTHWHQCINAGCEEKSGEAAHTGGTATCLQKATCSTCNELYGELAAHNLVKQNAQAANCSQEGWQEYWECSVCHEVYANAQGTGTKYTVDEWKHGAGKLEKNNDHIWSYTVNDNTITATCTRQGADNHTASISINASDAEYTGLAYTGTDESAWTNSSLGLTVPTVNYVGRNGTTYGSTTAPTDAGTYTAQITAGTVTASDDFEITKKEVELNWHNTVVTYNRTSQSPTVTVTNKALATDEVTVNVTFAGEHTNAGTYTATASSLSGTAAGNYKLPTTLPTHQFIIEPKAIGTTTITASYTKANPQTYTGNEFTQTISIVDGSNQLTLNSDYQLEGDIAKTMPGLYDTKVKGIGNYTGETTVEWEIVAAEIDDDDIHVTPYNAEYDGAYHSITVAPKEALAGATVTYSTTEDGTYSATNPSYKNAGEYTVYYKVEKTGHTTLKDFSTVTISHKEVTIGWSDTELTYNGSAQKPTATVTNKVNDDVVNVTVSGAETKAGTYTAVASGLYGDNSANYVLNYKLPIVEPSTSFTIYKAKVDAPTADSRTFTYNGQLKTYTLEADDLYTISNNTRTNAGTQTVTVALVDKDNYEWNGVTGTDDQKVADREYTFTINKASVTIPTADSTTYTYDGQPQTYGLTETDDYTVSNSTHTNAGEYEVDVILKDHNNYMWSDNTTANKKYTFTINKQDVTKPTALETVFTYSGQPQTYNLPTSEFYTVSNNTHTNAGTYKVGVVLNDGDNYKWAGESGELVEYNFIINRQSVTAPSKNDNTFTYDGTTKTYALAANDLYDIQNNAHIYAGTYTVSVSLKDTSNYKWSDNTIADKTYSFVINKAKVTKPAKDETTFTYNRAEQTYNLETSNLYTVLNNKATSAGNHTVTVTLNDKANYEWNVEAEDKSADQTYTFKINPLDISNLATLNLVSNSYEYTGEEITTSVSSATDGTVSIYEGTDFEVSGNKGTNVNTYTLTATFKGNYTGTKSASWAITKVASTFVAPTGVPNLVFNDQNQTLISAGSSSDGTVVYCLTEDGTYTTTLPSAKDADSYTVWYKVIGDQNHNDTTPEYLIVTISQADASATAPTAKENLVYNKQAQALVNAGTNVVGGTMMYSLEEDGEYSTSIPTGTNAGTYTVWYKVVADDNHIDTTPSSLNVTIAKANQNLTGNDVIATYGDTNKSVTIASDAAGSVISYAIKTGEPTDVISVNQTTGALAINKVGTTKVLVSASATDNYNAATKEVSVTVNKLTASLSWANTEFSYDGTLKTPSATVTNLVGEDVVNVTVTGSQTNAGTYTATASALTGTKASNYVLPEKPTHQFVITPKSIELTIVAATYTKQSPATYNGNPITQEVTVTDGSHVLVLDTDYELSGNTQETVPGLYATKVKGIGNYTGETTVEWGIEAAPIHTSNIDVTPYHSEYDGTSHSIKVEPKGDFADATVTYSETENGTYSTANPSYKDAGEYTVYYKVEKEHHTTLTGFSTVTINHKEVSVDWSNSEFTYNGSSQAPEATVNNALEGDEVNVIVSGAEVNAGTHTAVAHELTGEDAKNYKLGITHPSKTYTIAKADQTLTVNDVTLTYGNTGSVSATGNVADSTVTYGIKSGEATNVITINGNNGALTINKAGTTKVVASASETANYNGVTKEINVTVNKKVVAISWENTEFTYDGSEKIPTAEISNKVGNDDVSLTITGKKTNAGTYTASAALAGEKADNYALPATVTKEFVINKRPIEHADFTVLYNGSEDLPEYTGAEIEPTFIVEYNGVTLIKGTDYTISGTEKATDAGMYEVTITGIGNFKDSTKLDWRILDKPFSNDDIDVYSYLGEYDGESHGILVNVKVEGTTIEYSTDEGEVKTYGSANPTFSSVGTHNVYYKITKVSHEPYFGHSTVIIEPRTIYPDWSNTELVYTGSAQKPTATIGELDRVGSEVVYIEVIGEQTNVGTYTATAHSLSGANASNYRLEAHAPTAEFTIAPKALNVTITSLGGTYGQRFDGATATCSGYVEGESAPHLTLTYYRDQECTVITTNYDGADKDGTMPRNAGTYYVKADLTSDNNYSVVSTANNPQVKEFVVNKADLRSPLTNVVLDNVLFVKDGEVERVVNVKVTYGGVELIEGNDYELTGNSSSKLGKHTLSITGIGNFKGELTRDWAINEIMSNPTNVEIDEVEEGRVTLTITGDEDAPEIVITNPENMLSEDEITALKEGKITVDLILTIKVKEKENVNEDSLAEILKFIEDTENMIVFDITMDKVIRTLDGNGHVINIETQSVREPEGHVTVTIDVPSTIPSVQGGYKRVYTVIRSHENMDGTFTAEKLDTSYVSNKVTFESNKFSDYVLTYKDTRIPRPSTPNRYKAPNTGVGYENNSINKTIGLLSIVVLAGCIVKKKKED